MTTEYGFIVSRRDGTESPVVPCKDQETAEKALHVINDLDKTPATARLVTREVGDWS